MKDGCAEALDREERRNLEPLSQIGGEWPLYTESPRRPCHRQSGFRRPAIGNSLNSVDLRYTDQEPRSLLLIIRKHLTGERRVSV